jgi:hypothetical protein
MSRHRRPARRWRIASITEVIDRDPVARGLDGRLLAIGYTRQIDSTSWRAGPDVARTVMVGYRRHGCPPVTLTLRLLPSDLVQARPGEAG